MKWLPKTTTSSAVSDLIAGLTVATMLIPQGMAYASLAGLSLGDFDAEHPAADEPLSAANVGAAVLERAARGAQRARLRQAAAAAALTLTKVTCLEIS